MSKPVECTTQKANTNANSGLSYIMSYECRFIYYDTFAAPLGNIDSGRNYAWVGQGGCGKFKTNFSMNAKVP